MAGSDGIVGRQHFTRFMDPGKEAMHPTWATLAQHLRQVYAAIEMNLNFSLGFDNMYQAYHAASNLGTNELRNMMN